MRLRDLLPWRRRTPSTDFIPTPEPERTRPQLPAGEVFDDCAPYRVVAECPKCPCTGPFEVRYVPEVRRQARYEPFFEEWSPGVVWTERLAWRCPDCGAIVYTKVRTADGGESAPSAAA